MRLMKRFRVVKRREEKRGEETREGTEKKGRGGARKG